MYVPVRCDVRLADVPPNRQYAAAMSLSLYVDGPAYPPQRCFRVSGTTRLTYVYDLSLGDEGNEDELDALNDRQRVQRSHWQSHVSGEYVKAPACSGGQDESWGLVFHAHPHCVNVTGAKVHVGSKRTIAVRNIRRLDMASSPGDSLAYDSMKTGVFEAVLAEPLPTGPTAAGQTVSLVLGFNVAVRPAIKSGGGASNGHSGMCGLYYATPPSVGAGGWGSDLSGEAPRGCSPDASISASEYGIFSHFEVHHARRGFPCIDDPQVRVVWSLAIATATAGVDGAPVPSTALNVGLLQPDAAPCVVGTPSNKAGQKGGKKGTGVKADDTSSGSSISLPKVAQMVEAACDRSSTTTVPGGIRYGFFCTPPASSVPVESIGLDTCDEAASECGAENIQLCPPSTNLEFAATPVAIPAYTFGISLLLGRDHVFPTEGTSTAARGGFLQRLAGDPSRPTLVRTIHIPSLLHAAAGGKGPAPEVVHLVKVASDKAIEGIALLEKTVFRNEIPLGASDEDKDAVAGEEPFCPPCVATAIGGGGQGSCGRRSLNVLFVPLMPIGGMEHHGNIFLNESIIRPPLKAVRSKVEDEVITLVVHELCHHWLGNVVGMPFAVKEGLCQVLERAIGNILQGLGNAHLTSHGMAPSQAANATSSTTSASKVPPPSQTSSSCTCGKEKGIDGGDAGSGGGGSSTNSKGCSSATAAQVLTAPREGDELTGLTYQHALNNIQRAVAVAGWEGFTAALSRLVREWRGGYIFDTLPDQTSEEGGEGAAFSEYLRH